MKTKAAVLYTMEQPAPYAESRPLVIEELDLAGVQRVAGDAGAAAPGER